MITLYGTPVSGNAYKARLLLACSGSSSKRSASTS